MVAATSAEEKQSLLHAPETDRGSNPTRGSFARLAVAGSLVAGLALAGLASSGAVQGTALAPAGVFQLGAKHTAHAAHASKHKSSGKWWEAEIGESTESSTQAESSKQAESSNKAESSKKAGSSKKESSSTEAHDVHATGRVTPHEPESSEKDAEAKDAEPEPAVNAADKSQDMLTRLFGDEFGESSKGKTRAVVDPEEQAEELAKAKAAAKETRVDPLEEFQEEQAADAARRENAGKDALDSFVGDDKKSKSKSESSSAKTSSTTGDEKTAAVSDDADSATPKPLAPDATESEREAWFEAQREIKEKEEEKKEAKEEKEEEKKEKEEEEAAKKAAMIPVERERVVAADANPEWFVSFTVTHKERDEAIPCGERHGAAIEEFVGQMAGSENLTPRVMHVSACENPTPTSRTYDVDFALGDVFDKKKEEASAEAKSLVKLFSTDAVTKMLATNGLGESEAKAVASSFSVETSKVRFDQRPQFEAPTPDPAALLAPFPLSEKHVGHFAVSGAQSDAQIKNMIAQVAVNRGMPADNIPNLSIDKCPLDYRVRFDVTVHGFGCPTGEAAEDGAFGEQYANYVYKYAAEADPPIAVPDSLVVSDCRVENKSSSSKSSSSDEDSDNTKGDEEEKEEDEDEDEKEARESQTLTVQFDLPRVSERTDPTKIADAVKGLFTSENIRDHASSVGVSAHALSQLTLGVDVGRPGSELVLDPDSKACTFGEVVFNGQLPPELAKKAKQARGENVGVDDVIQSSSGDRMAMMKELSEQVSSGFISSSAHRLAMRDEAAAAAQAAAVPASAASAASAATAATAATSTSAAASTTAAATTAAASTTTPKA